jgi:hypothetical protein
VRGHRGGVGSVEAAECAQREEDRGRDRYGQRDRGRQQSGDVGKAHAGEFRATLEADREQQVDRQQLEHRLG